MITINRKKDRCMLWKDEQGDTFLLLKFAEVYEYSENVVRLHIWSSKKRSTMRKRGLILKEIHLDEPFTIIDIDRSNLDEIINLGRYRKRFNLGGSTHKRLESVLAHKIVPYNPEINKEG